MSIWKSSPKDKIRNGAIAGGLAGIAIKFGTEVTNFINGILPESWMFLGPEWSVVLYLIIAGALTGMIIDKY